MTDLKAPGPERPLYRGPPPPPPKLVNTPPDVGSDERTESYQMNYEFSTDKLRAGKFGIWTKFLSVVGLGVDLAYEWDDRKTQIYTFKHIETVEFSPSDEYIQKCLTAPPVARVISRTKRPLYIVTGIKAVTGATARTCDATGKKGRVGFDVDGTLLGGAPVSLGPEAEIERRAGQDVAFDGASDFVFAFRVQRIKISRKGEVSHEDYIKGAMLDAHKPQRKLEGVDASFDVSELGRADLEAEGFQVEDVGSGEACGW